MKLVTFARRGKTHIGLLIRQGEEEVIFDLNQAQPGLPADMAEFLKLGDTAWALATSALSSADGRCCVPEAEASLLAPVPRPGKIICLGYNYADHTDGGTQTRPEFPTFFAKFANVIIGPKAPIVHPGANVQMDYEAELAVVIGKRARRVPEAHALDYVAGYTSFNDVSARDVLKRSSQWTLGKSFDTFGPLGPALVTTGEIPDPTCLDLTLTLNGQEMQRSNTCNQVFSIPFLIAYLSQVMTLEPGDVIATGTPGGTGALRTPPVFMRPGDEVRIQIEKIGELVNPIVAEA